MYNHIQSATEQRKFSELVTKYPGAVISYSHLRIENRIVNTKQLYNFPILITGSEISTENKLDKNDLFVCTRLGFFIYERNTSTKNEGRQALQTYVNETFFTTGTNFVKGDLETAYNGFISIKKGTTVIMEKLDTHNFKWVADTQQSSATNKSSQNRDSAFIEMTPIVDLPGRESVSIDATFPVFATIQWQSDATNTDAQMVLFPRGFLVKGANV